MWKTNNKEIQANYTEELDQWEGNLFDELLWLKKEVNLNWIRKNEEREKDNARLFTEEDKTKPKESIINKKANLSINGWFSLGMNVYLQESFEDAVFAWSQVIAKSKADSPAYANRGSAHYRLGNYEQAIHDYSQALSFDSSLGMVYFNRAAAYAKLRNYPKSFSDYHYALKLHPKNITIAENLIELYLITDQYIECEKHLEKAIAMTGKNKDRAVLLYLQCIVDAILEKDFVLAEKKLDEILEEGFKFSWSLNETKEWITKNQNLGLSVREYILHLIQKIEKYQNRMKQKKSEGIVQEAI